MIDRAGQFEWHDHRIHWMSPLMPPEVTNRTSAPKVFEWEVPIRVGAQPATIYGRLFWVPEEGTKTPVAAIVALVAIVGRGGAGDRGAPAPRAHPAARLVVNERRGRPPLGRAALGGRWAAEPHLRVCRPTHEADFIDRHWLEKRVP